jgi:YD repeat-containing protein
LAYSSAGTDSPSGYGWAIVGGQVSTIRRCVESSRRSDRPVAIQFLATDPLCLDGRRLVLIAGVAGKKGAEYRTEPESFTKVTIDGDDALGPTEFSVFSMSGLIHSYGSATDPSLTIEGPRQKWTVPFPAKVLGTRSDADIVKETATARLGWLRGSTRDRFSQPNMVWFKYLHPADARTTDGQQEPLLDAIEYVDMGTIRTRTIKFNYVSRNPLSERFGYFAGLSIKSTKLLQSIDIRVAEAGATSPSSVRFYDFTYTTSEWSQRPLLKEVMECDGNPLTVTARAVSCKLPTVFSYESGSFNFRDIPTSISDLRQADDKPFWSISVADINRDGLDDIVYRARPPGADVSAPPHWFYRLSTGEGLGDPVDMLLEENTVPGDPVLIDFALNDGRPDIAVPRSDSSYAYYINTTSGFVLATVPGGEGVTQSLQIGDFGNKGQMVILRPLTGGRWGYRLLAGSAENATMSALSGDLGTASWLENPLQAGWSTYVADIDGDTAPDFLTPTIGAPDYLAATIQLKVPAPMPVEGSNPPIDPPDWGLADTTLLASKAGDQVKYLVFDHNGDGNADVLRLRQSAGEAPALILNTANGFNAPATIGLGGAAFIRLGPGTVPKDLSDVGARILDFDGDGRDDILLVDDGVTRDSSNPGAPTRSNLTVMLSRPGGFEERNLGIPIGAPADGPAPPNSSAVRNFKQTVLIDLNGDGLRDIVQVNASDFKLHIFVREGERPDLLVGVKDGMGRRASINYRPMTDPTVYTVGTGCVSPQLCVTSASRVVSSYFLDNGTGLNEFRCKYEDGRYDLEGAGFLGFSKWSLTDLATSTTVTETYNLFVREKVPSFNGIDPSATVYGYIGLPVTRAVETVAPGFVRKQAATIKYEFIRTYNGVSYYSRPTSTNSTDDETRGMVTTRLLTQTQTPQYDPTLSNFGLTSGSTVVTSTEAGDVTDSWASTYDNFPERWLLGLEKELTVTSKTATEQTSRKTLSHPDPITGVLNSTEIEPTAGTSDQYLLVELGRSPRGQVTSVKRTDRLGNARVEGVGYDLQEVHPRTLTNALGHVTTVDTDAALGMPTVVTDPNNIKTTFDHDAFGRRRRISLPGGGGQSTTYVRQLEAGSASSDGRFVMKATTKFDGGGETLTIINRLGQQIRQEAKNLDGSSSFVSQAYNNLGLLDSATRPAKVGNAPGASTLWKYDPLGRVILRTRPEDGRDRAGVPVTEAAMSRSYEGLVATFNDEFERQTKVTSDPLGRVTKSEARNDAGQWLPTKFTYWPFSLLRAVSRNNGVGSDSRTTEAVYDILGRQTQISDPDTGTRTTKYNAFGEVREETDAVGAVSTYIPDNEGRVSEKHDKDGTTKFIWDTATNGKGKIAETQSASGVRRQFFYDGAGRMNREIWTMAGSTFQVDYTFGLRSRIRTIQILASFHAFRMTAAGCPTGS